MSYFYHFIYVTLEFIHINHPFRTLIAKKIPASRMKLGFITAAIGHIGGLKPPTFPVCFIRKILITLLDVTLSKQVHQLMVPK